MKSKELVDLQSKLNLVVEEVKTGKLDGKEAADRIIIIREQMDALIRYFNSKEAQVRSREFMHNIEK